MSFAERVIAAAKPYLGIATEDFLRRTAKSVVGKDLADIGPDDIESLAYWVRLGAQKLMATERVDELIGDITSLR